MTVLLDLFRAPQLKLNLKFNTMVTPNAYPNITLTTGRAKRTIVSLSTEQYMETQYGWPHGSSWKHFSGVASLSNMIIINIGFHFSYSFRASKWSEVMAKPLFLPSL